MPTLPLAAQMWHDVQNNLSAVWWEQAALHHIYAYASPAARAHFGVVPQHMLNAYSHECGWPAGPGAAEQSRAPCYGTRSVVASHRAEPQTR